MAVGQVQVQQKQSRVQIMRQPQRLPATVGRNQLQARPALEQSVHDQRIARTDGNTAANSHPAPKNAPPIAQAVPAAADTPEQSFGVFKLALSHATQDRLTYIRLLESTVPGRQNPGPDKPGPTPEPDDEPPEDEVAHERHRPGCDPGVD